MKNKEITWSNLSLCDSENRVFELNNIFYRGVFKKTSSVLQFINSDLYIELIDFGYIPKTTKSSIKNDNFEVVFEHESANYITYPHEWSFEMHRNACILYLNVFEIAIKHGYILKDGHSYNIVFFNNEPKFVDIGSFVKFDKTINLEEFNRTMFLPLLIWSKGYYTVALNIIRDDRAKLSLNDTLKIYFGVAFSDRPSFNLLWKLYSFHKNEKKQLINSCIISKRKIIDELKIKQYESTWGNYHAEYNLENKIESTPRFDKIINYINKYSDIQTVYDIACNQGIVSKLISENCQNITRIIATDYDENAINYFYNTLKKYKNITVGISDLICPISNFQEKSITERFKSDCVLVLALTHHLILGQKYHIDVVLGRLKSLTNKYLFIEFMPKGLWGGGDCFPTNPEFYTLDWFELNLQNYFIILEKETLEVNRILFVCILKNKLI